MWQTIPSIKYCMTDSDFKRFGVTQFCYGVIVQCLVKTSTSHFYEISMTSAHGFGRRQDNRMMGFEVVWTIMLHKEFQACAIHPPYKYSSSRHICLHRIRHSSLLQRSIVKILVRRWPGRDLNLAVSPII